MKEFQFTKLPNYTGLKILKRENKLHQLERDELGDVKGKSILHLQCHFGMDTLSLKCWELKLQVLIILKKL